ncbi:hypothetical protein [Microbispora rosea]|uniref:hypothetical protein n=1 Tax=Microbispora rosea TaxID=58117 RepID=UPI0037A67260
MTGRFKVGEVVDITIKGVRINNEDADGIVTVLADNPLGATTRYEMPPQAAIERVGPAEWPPQPGDLWRDQRGGLWFAADIHDVDETDVPEIVMVWTHEDYRLRPDLLNQRSGPLTLVHREELADEPKCRLCGCTETNPCEGGCRRVDDPQTLGALCSSHLVEAQHLEPGQVVRHQAWHGGHRVRIDRVFAWEAGQVSVFYQDTTAYYPLVEVHVAADLPVLLDGGAR